MFMIDAPLSAYSSGLSGKRFIGSGSFFPEMTERVRAKRVARLSDRRVARLSDRRVSAEAGCCCVQGVAAGGGIDVFAGCRLLRALSVLAGPAESFSQPSPRQMSAGRTSRHFVGWFFNIRRAIYGHCGRIEPTG
jgi:hypothetical protein